MIDFRKLIEDSITVKQAILKNEALLQTLQQVCDVIAEAFRNGKRVYFCGNGGSAADAQHLAAEFSGRFYKNRKALPAEALHCNTSYLTAVANDYGYNDVYARLVEGIMDTGDALIGFSTSGNSPNIVKAFEAAKAKGVITIGFTGMGGAALKGLSDHLLAVPSTVTPRIQEAHILLGHIVCETVENALFEG